jgi:hypothetical protein
LWRLPRELQRASRSFRERQRLSESFKELQRACRELQRAPESFLRASESSRERQELRRASKSNFTELQRASESFKELQRASETSKELQRASESLQRASESFKDVSEFVSAVSEFARRADAVPGVRRFANGAGVSRLTLVLGSVGGRQRDRGGAGLAMAHAARSLATACEQRRRGLSAEASESIR